MKIEEAHPEAHSPDRLTSISAVSKKKSFHNLKKNISDSSCVGRPFNHVQRNWRRQWFKITWLFCATILTSNLQVVLHFSLLCTHTCPSLRDSRAVLKMFFPWHELHLCILSCDKVLIETGLQRLTAWGGWLAVGSVIQQLACFYSQWTKDIMSKSVIKTSLLSWEWNC